MPIIVQMHDYRYRPADLTDPSGLRAVYALGSTYILRTMA